MQNIIYCRNVNIILKHTKQFCFIFVYSWDKQLNILRHIWSYTCSPLDWRSDGAVTGPIWSLRCEVVQCPTSQSWEATWSARGVAVKCVPIHGLGPCKVLQRTLALPPGECGSPGVTLHCYTHVLWLTGHYRPEGIQCVTDFTPKHNAFHLKPMCGLTSMEGDLLTGQTGAVSSRSSYANVVNLSAVQVKQGAVVRGASAGSHISVSTAGRERVRLGHQRGWPWRHHSVWVTHRICCYILRNTRCCKRIKWVNYADLA